MLSIIVAMDENRVIGRSKENDMPWHLPNDLRHFKETTMGHTIIMGRKTFESLGGVLPGRKHIVLTRKDNYDVPEEVEVFSDIDQLLQYVKEHKREEKQFFVIGGGHIFRQLLPYVSRMYITRIAESFDGDVTFPSFSETEWEKVCCEKGKKDEKNRYDYYFLTYKRRTP